MPDTSVFTMTRSHALFWGGAFALFIAFVWIFGAILLPFVLGLAIAYLLDPLVNVIGRYNVPRWIAALIILGLFFVFVIAALMLAAPPLYREVSALAEAMPGYIEQLAAMMTPYSGWLQDQLNNGNSADLQKALQDNIGKALGVGMSVLAGLASGGQAIAGFLSVTVLTPIVAFFMMKEWPVMKDWIDSLLPRHSYQTIKDLLAQIDTKLSGFVRGQLSVAFVLAVAYALALSLAGLKFGFLIGVMAGVLSIIPLVGSTVGLLTAVLVAWFQTGEWGYVGLIACIFLVGQFIEGNFLTPKLLGKSVGLHPLWILFALLAGGSLFGILGMLLAVPVVAVIGVLAAFTIAEYRKSPYYQDKVKPQKTAAKKAPAKRKTQSKSTSKRSSS